MNLFRKKLQGWDTFTNERDSGIYPYLAATINPDANTWVDITSIENWHLFAHRISGDFIWQQRRVKEVFDAKAGATAVDRWNNCTVAEKNIILYYNQFRGIAGGAEDTAKVTHLITTGQAVDVPGAVTWLKRNHAEALERGQPSIVERVNGAKLTQIIITYLSPVNTDQLLNIVSTYLFKYKEYSMRGTIDPDNPAGIYDYINSTDIFVGAGLCEEGFTCVNGEPISNLKDRLNDLLFGDNSMTI